jgi:hypothetical protein
MLIPSLGMNKGISSRKHRPSMMVSGNAEEVEETLTLHPMDYVGIDTCSALSVSSEVADFIYLDRSEEARNSVSLNGVGEGGPEVLARGPMLVSTLDSGGRQTFLVDPSGVLVASSPKQRDFESTDNKG